MSRFTSGPWVGFYTYSGHRRKFLMDLVLEFKRGRVVGEGHDDVGGFVIAGAYSTEAGECAWEKTYVGRHTVVYRGFGEGPGIWGTWALPGARGGFQIWPIWEPTPPVALEAVEPVSGAKTRSATGGKPA